MWVCRLPVHIGPAVCTVFPKISGEFAAAQRADVGIAPYMTPANPHRPANFKRRASLPQPFKGSCYQIWCIVTGGAYLSAREVTWCVRNDYKNRFLPELYPQDAPNASQRPFSPPIFSGKAEKMGPPEVRRKRPRRNEPPRYARSLLSSASVSSFPNRKRFAGLRLGFGLDGNIKQPHSGRMGLFMHIWVGEVILRK